MVTQVSEHTHSVEAPVTVSYQTEAAPETAPAPEVDAGEFLDELEADLSRPSAPPDARMNEQGQLVWVDDEGTVYAQNPDGSLMAFDVETESWKPLE